MNDKEIDNLLERLDKILKDNGWAVTPIGRSTIKDAASAIRSLQWKRAGKISAPSRRNNGY